METDIEARPSPASEPGRSRLHVVLSLTRRQRAALEVSAEANGLTTTAEIKRLILKELSYESRVRGRENFAISRLVWRRQKASGGLTDERLETEARRILEENPKYDKGRLAWELAKYQAEITKGPADIVQVRRVAEHVLYESEGEREAAAGTDAGSEAMAEVDHQDEMREWTRRLLDHFSPQETARRFVIRFGRGKDVAERLVSEVLQSDPDLRRRWTESPTS